MAASSATATAPISEKMPPMTQADMIRVGSPSAAATVLGKRNMPTPTVVPKTSAKPKPSPRMRRRGCLVTAVILQPDGQKNQVTVFRGGRPHFRTPYPFLNV